jgi:hypothetical protein
MRRIRNEAYSYILNSLFFYNIFETSTSISSLFMTIVFIIVN